MTNNLFGDLIEIAGGNVAAATARIREFSDFFDGVHASALNGRAAARPEPARPAMLEEGGLGPARQL